MNDFIEMLLGMLRETEGTQIAGVNHEDGDFGIDVGMMDGAEFHIEVTQQ